VQSFSTLHKTKRYKKRTGIFPTFVRALQQRAGGESTVQDLSISQKSVRTQTIGQRQVNAKLTKPKSKETPSFILMACLPSFHSPCANLIAAKPLSEVLESEPSHSPAFTTSAQSNDMMEVAATKSMLNIEGCVFRSKCNVDLFVFDGCCDIAILSSRNEATSPLRSPYIIFSMGRPSLVSRSQVPLCILPPPFDLAC
jgi:hypothetical protein